MSRVVFIRADGVEREVDVPLGMSLMDGARQAGVEGIEGDCGGNLSCATCHVYVEEDRLSQLNSMATMEDEMLEVVCSERRPTSRLSCQLVMSRELDGVRVTIPASQY